MRKRITIKEIEHVGSNIDAIVKEYDISYMEACLKYCDDNEIEVELVGDIIRKNPDIKAKIEDEANVLNFLKPTTNTTNTTTKTNTTRKTNVIQKSKNKS